MEQQSLLPWYSNWPEYRAVSAFYKGKKGEKSGRDYIHHIDEGLKILDHISANRTTQQAWCLHPLVQDDAALIAAKQFGTLREFHGNALAMAMEYRWVANNYLSKHELACPRDVREVKLSCLDEVNQMLIADKVQNAKDFLVYVSGRHPEKEYLKGYFKKWLEALGVSSDMWVEMMTAMFPETVGFIEGEPVCMVL